MKRSLPAHFEVFFVGLLAFYCVVFFGAEAIDSVTASFVEMRSEYTAIEQLSKFSLIVIMLVAFFALNFEKREYYLKAAAALFALSITIYLSESNMIREKYQPVMGLLLIVPTAYWLLRASAWLGLILFGVGIFITALGSLKDLVHEGALMADVWVPMWFQSALDNFKEELMDTLGISILVFSAIIALSKSLRQLVETNPGALVVILFCSALVAIGNGLGHYQYDPSVLLLLVGFSLTFVGLMALWFIEKHFLPAEYRLPTSKRYYYYLPVAILFVLLPFYWDQFNNFTAILFWASSIFLGRKLYKKAIGRLSDQAEEFSEDPSQRSDSSGSAV